MLLDPDNINLLYNLGCSMVSLRRAATLAIELLAPVFARAQPQNLIWFGTDTRLDPIRDDPRLQGDGRAGRGAVGGRLRLADAGRVRCRRGPAAGSARAPRTAA